MISRYRSRKLGRIAAGALSLGLGLACSAHTTQDLMGDAGHGANAAGGGGAGTAGSISLSGSMNVEPAPYARCTDPTDLQCLKVDCPADSSPSTTSVSGKVYDPAGRVPLYNAVVYVFEEEKLPALGAGAACERCSAHFPPEPVVAVDITEADGSFMVTDMPVGKNIPLVIQLGKWRRVVRVDTKACTDTPLTIDQTRLPRNSSEGHLPRIAMATGGSDALECLLKKIGVDESEFTSDSGEGRIHMYSGYRAAKELQVGGQSVPLRPAEDLWADADKMLEYDMMLLGCEGEDNLWNAPEDDDFPDGALPRPASMHLEVREYADLGGRIFGSHWGHRWINSDGVTPDNPYPKVASFSKSAFGIDEVTVSVDTTFPKGVAFRDWLSNVGASTTPGELELVEAEHSVDSVDDTLAQRWIYGTDPGGRVGENRVPEMVQYFSFTTPVGEPECGRMVFSDVHVSFGGEPYHDVPFPQRCEISPGDELSPQEKALEFMIFDLSSCIQKEDDEPPMPVVVVK